MCNGVERFLYCMVLEGKRMTLIFVIRNGNLFKYVKVIDVDVHDGFCMYSYDDWRVADISQLFD